MVDLRTWWRSVPERGRVESVRTLLNRFGYQSYRYVITSSPAAGPPAIDHVGNVRFRVASPHDLDRLQEFEPYGRGALVRQYVETDHDWLVVACDGDRIVATRRASRVIRDSVVSKAITLRPHQFWGADVFCLPEYRNKGIGRHLQVFGDRVVAASGYTEMVGSIDVRNLPSLRAAHAAGRGALCYVSFVRVLFWTRLRVSDRVPARFWAPRFRPTRSAERGDASQPT